MSTATRRVVLIVLDGCGIGALPDAERYGDVGANTLAHVAQACGGLCLPNLQCFGLGNLLEMPGVAPNPAPTASWGRMRERSVGKDTTTGHWELAGVIQQDGFACYPQGFPAEIIDAFVRDTGLVPLGNLAASGTEILKSLGADHLESGRPIVYTSSDSVFQIAAHEDVIPVERLYEICRIARRILDPYRVGRVIARPFVGSEPASYRRTSRRHDFSIPPTGITVLDCLHARGLPVVGVGKISDIFAGRGLSASVESVDNLDGMAKTLRALDTLESGLLFVNLVDFDTQFGHRLDARGFGQALAAFDRWLPALCERLRGEDLLLVTADHGCDPTTAGTDHSREYVPILAWRRAQTLGRALGERESFADVAATVAAALGVTTPAGNSMWSLLE